MGSDNFEKTIIYHFFTASEHMIRNNRRKLLEFDETFSRWLLSIFDEGLEFLWLILATAGLRGQADFNLRPLRFHLLPPLWDVHQDMVFPEAFVRGGAPVVSAFFADFLAANCVYIFGAADIARRATTRAQRHQRTTAGVPKQVK